MAARGELSSVKFYIKGDERENSISFLLAARVYMRMRAIIVSKLPKCRYEVFFVFALLSRDNLIKVRTLTHNNDL